MARFQLAFLFAFSVFLQVQSCNVKVSSFRAYENSFFVFDITYGGDPKIVGMKLGVSESVLNVESIDPIRLVLTPIDPVKNPIEVVKSNISTHAISLKPHNLRVGEKIYYKLFLEMRDGIGNCETETDNVQIQEIMVLAQN